MKHLIRVYFLGGALLLLSITVAVALTTVSNTDKYSYAANAGWINWQGDVTNGAQFTNKIASGFIYSANVGWINLGDGSPANGTSYSNTTASDFGVNVDSTSDPQASILSGYAYGANIGWISFDVKTQAGVENQPRIDKTTGILKGYAWAANVGWIALESPGIAQVVVHVFSEAEDWSLYQ